VVVVGVMVRWWWWWWWHQQGGCGRDGGGGDGSGVVVVKGNSLPLFLCVASISIDYQLMRCGAGPRIFFPTT
jgi:hypothetical protein